MGELNDLIEALKELENMAVRHVQRYIDAGKWTSRKADEFYKRKWEEIASIAQSQYPGSVAICCASECDSDGKSHVRRGNVGLRTYELCVYGRGISGWFKNHGDGGYLNWCIVGDEDRYEKNGKHVAIYP